MDGWKIDSVEKPGALTPQVPSNKSVVFFVSLSLSLSLLFVQLDVLQHCARCRIQMKCKAQEGDAPSHNVTAASRAAVSHLSLYGQ